MRFSLPAPRPKALAVPAAAVLIGSVLVLVGSTGATAAPVRHAAPAAPASVTATGTATSVTLAWKAGRASAAVTGYTIAISPTAGQARDGILTTRPSARAVSYSNLTTGTTYALSIVSTGRFGHSRPVTVTYTPQAPQSVFALDSQNTLVRLPAAGGTPVAVLGDVVAYTVDPGGDAYAVTSTKVVEVSASGTLTTLVEGESSATDIQLDASRNVYLLEGTDVVRVAAGPAHTVSTIASTDVAPAGFAVSTSGAVTVLESTNGVHSLVTYPAPGATPTTTTLDDSPYFSPLTAAFDAKGNLYYRSIATGASGNINYQRVAARSTTPSQQGSGFVRGGVGLTDDFYLLQSATWCSSYGIGTGTCTPDLRVGAIQVTSDTGVTRSVPVTGLSLSTADEKTYGAGTSVTSDRAGRIYVAGAAGVVRYAATGGAPTTLAAGSFTDVQVTR